MRVSDEGFWYPNIDENICVECNLCRKSCPVLNHQPKAREPLILACKAKSHEKRLESASGGVFALLAEYVLDKGGVVYGAAFAENWGVQHICVKRKEDLAQLKGSKYVQSKIGDSYARAKEQLNKNQLVLFSGTPCQIAGLKSYLGADYSNLICVDVVCHGVPSPNVWQAYLKELAGKRQIKRIQFRDKKNGVENAPLKFCLDNGECIAQPYRENTFIQGFIANLYLRRSCYQCHFKGVVRDSDLTIGDFWGIEKCCPDFADPYGISLVIVQSDKGKKYLEHIETEMECVPCTATDAQRENPCITSSVELPQGRKEFFECYRVAGVSSTVKKMLWIPYHKRLLAGWKSVKYNTKYWIYKKIKGVS